MSDLTKAIKLSVLANTGETDVCKTGVLTLEGTDTVALVSGRAGAVGAREGGVKSTLLTGASDLSFKLSPRFFSVMSDKLTLASRLLALCHSSSACKASERAEASKLDALAFTTFVNDPFVEFRSLTLRCDFVSCGSVGNATLELAARALSMTLANSLVTLSIFIPSAAEAVSAAFAFFISKLFPKESSLLTVGPTALSREIASLIAASLITLALCIRATWSSLIATVFTSGKRNSFGLN
jgi:hypothetical protein